MKWILKRTIPILAILFICITIFRVSTFAAGESDYGWRFISAVFAVSLAISIFACSFFTGYENTKIPAMIGLVFFVFIDGYFNFIETLMWSVDQDRWSQQIEFMGRVFYTYRYADIMYGLFPTVAVAILGNLYRYTLLIQDNKPRGLWKELQNIWDSLLVEEEPKKQSAPEPKVAEKPEWLGEPPKSKKHFLSLIRKGKITIPEDLTPVALNEWTPVSLRSTQDWLKEGRQVYYERQIRATMVPGQSETQSGNGHSASSTKIPETDQAGTKHNNY